MTTKTAEQNGLRCVICGDKTSRDLKRKGYVRHIKVKDCHKERGLKGI